MKFLLAPVLFCYVMAACARGPSLAHPPPCDALGIPSPAGWSRGQCVRVNDRVLTAAHLVAAHGEGYVPREVWLRDSRADVAGFRAGSFGAAGDAALHHIKVERDAPWDWAAFVVSGPRASAAGMSIGGWPARTGETLYLVGYDPDRDFSRSAAVPLRVAEWDADEPIAAREGLLPTLGPPGRHQSGFSGGFVGRYDRASGAWEYVGQYVASGEGEYTPGSGSKARRIRCHIVMRPPDDILDWLAGKTPMDTAGSID